MAGERSGQNATGATADQAPEHGEPPYQPRDDRGGDRPGVDDHEEPIDGPEPEPKDEPKAEDER